MREILYGLSPELSKISGDISSWKSIFLLFGLVTALIFFWSLYLLFLGRPNIQKRLTTIVDNVTEINKKVEDIRQSSINLPTPQIVTEEIPASGDWHELNGNGFTENTKVININNNNQPLPTYYINSTKLLVKWPPKQKLNSIEVEVRGEYKQKQNYTFQYSSPQQN